MPAVRNGVTTCQRQHPPDASRPGPGTHPCQTRPDPRWGSARAKQLKAQAHPRAQLWAPGRPSLGDCPAWSSHTLRQRLSPLGRSPRSALEGGVARDTNRGRRGQAGPQQGPDDRRRPRGTWTGPTCRVRPHGLTGGGVSSARRGRESGAGEDHQLQSPLPGRLRRRRSPTGLAPAAAASPEPSRVGPPPLGVQQGPLRGETGLGGGRCCDSGRGGGAGMG